MKNDGVIEKGFLKLVWPIALEWFFLSFAGLADVWLASLISDQAVAATGSIFLVIIIATSISSAISQGSGIILAPLEGAHLQNRVAENSTVLLVMNSILCLGISIVLIVFRKAFCRMLNLPSELLDMAETYLFWSALSLIFLELSWSFSTIINVKGHTRFSMGINLGSNILRILIGYTLVTGQFGFPQLGIEGIGIGILISRILAIIAIAFLAFLKLDVKIVFPIKLKQLFSDSRELLKVSFPLILEPFSYHGTQVIMISMIAVFGANDLAARSYTNTIISSLECFLFAIAYGSQIIQGHLVGAQMMNDFKKQTVFGLVLSLSTSTLIGTVLFLSGNIFLKLFSSDSGVIEISTSLLHYSIFIMFIKGMNCIYGAALRSVKDTQFLSLTSIVFMWLLFLPLAYLFSVFFGFGIKGLWMAMCVDECLRLFVLYYRYRSPLPHIDRIG